MVKLAACVVVCLAVVTVSASPPPAAVNFLAARDHFFPELPQAVVLADFTGDAKLDLAIATARNNAVALVTNDGSWSFVPVGTRPVALAAADLNSDLHTDLAVVNSGSGDVSLLLGNGDGTFQPVSSFPVGRGPLSLVAADVNRDNNSDVIVANEGGPLSVLLGNGDGTLQPPLQVSDNLVSFAIGDFNADGAPDIVGGAADVSAVSVLLGNGDGSFQPPLQAPLDPPYQADAVLAADFDGDGRVDVAVSSYGVYVLFGNGDGTFGDSWSGGNLRARGFAVADVNGDTTFDLLAAAGQDSIAVLLGTGNRQFQTTRSVVVAATVSSSIAMGDLNGDRKVDIVNVGSRDYFSDSGAYRGFLSVRIGRGDGTFHATLGLETDERAAEVRTGDFNGDGHADLAFSVYFSRAVITRLGNGDGTFQSPSAFLTVSHMPDALALGDFDGDSRTDIVVSGREAPDIVLFGGNGDGTFRLATLVPTGSVVENIEVDDLNHDLKVDLIVVDDLDRISLLTGNGDGTFGAPSIVLERASYPTGLALADFNNDSHLDLAAGQYYGLTDRYYNFVMLLGNGDGSFQPPIVERTSGSLRNLVVGDFDGDSRLDLAALKTSGPGPFVSTSAGVALGNGDGTFKSRSLLPAPSGPDFVIAADFDGDRNVDLGVVGDSTFWVLRGAGDGSFSVQSIGFSAVPSPVSTAIGDFTSDGRADVAIAGDGWFVAYGPGTVGIALLLGFSP
jgi:hypothetical protein